MSEWSVYVELPSGPEFIGTVEESTEKHARCAALSKYGADGERNGDSALALFEDDSFSVSKK